MCMQGMVPSGKALVALCIGAVIFSPVILVGALGYGALRGGHAVASKVAEHHPGRRMKNKISQFKKRVLKKLGRDQVLLAIQDVQAKLAAANADPKLHLQLATLYFLNLDYAHAIPSIDQFLASDPKNVNGNFLKGQSLSYQENFDAAMQAFKIAYENAGNDDQQANFDGVEGTVATAITKVDVLLEMISCKVHQALVSDQWRHSPKVVEDLKEALQFAEELHERLTGNTQQKLSPWVDNEKRAIFLIALAKFSLFCQDEKDLDLLRSVRDMLDEMPKDAELHSFCSQVFRLLGDDNQADQNLNDAVRLDQNVFKVDHSNHDELVAPWPLPKIRVDGAQTFQEHQWNERTFHKVSFCEHCTKYINPKLFTAKHFECVRCGIRVHADCKSACKNDCTKAATTN